MGKIQNIAVFFLSFLLTAAILMPSAIKFSHHFIDHGHVRCHEQHQTHFHQFDFECKLFDFQHAPQILFLSPLYSLFIPNNPSELNYSYYHFLSNYQKLHFALRAPPLS